VENHLTSLSVGLHRFDFQYLLQKLVWKRTTWDGQVIEEYHYSYDGDFLGIEQEVFTKKLKEYAYGAGLPGGIGGLLSLNNGGNLYSYLYDGKGNVTALLDGTGNVAQTYQYDPFGVPMMKTNVFLNQPMRFSTKPYDEQTGLSYYGYRYYAPALGRWLTRDPIGEKGGLNLYEFVENNPINKIDPWGEISCKGYWSLAGWHADYWAAKCWCYWRCVPWDYPIWCDQNYHHLPRTHGIHLGSYCLCTSKPGPDEPAPWPR
jgi:RHS repeat-associated protein